jgi:hypothetical protein
MLANSLAKIAKFLTSQNWGEKKRKRKRKTLLVSSYAIEFSYSPF